MELFSKKRRGLYVFFKHVRDISKLEKYGNVITISRKNRYIYLYLDDNKINVVEKELKNKKFVTKVIKSELVDLSLDFTKSIEENFDDNQENII